MELGAYAAEGASERRWTILLSLLPLSICLPNLVLSYGVLLLSSADIGAPLWLGFLTPTIFLLSSNVTQCWCRDAADSWGGSVGYRVMAAIGLLLIVVSLLLCAFAPHYMHPFIYGISGGLGSSLVLAQFDAVIFETYVSRVELIRGYLFTCHAIGQAIFPHILTALVETYGYRWSYLLLSAIMLQTLPTIIFLKVKLVREMPILLSRYSDFGRPICNQFDTQQLNGYEMQIHDLRKKSWKSPSDDNLNWDNEFIDEEDVFPTLTPPSSPEGKRRNIFGVEILPEIPEEIEEEEEDHEVIDLNKKRLSNAIKRFSILGDSIEGCIANQIRRDSHKSQSSGNDGYDKNQYSEIEVIYNNTTTPRTDVAKEKISYSFSFRCQSTYCSIKRKILIPSYKLYRIKRRLHYFKIKVNDTFIKPLMRSFFCWKFYPAMMLFFTKLSLSSVVLVLLPVIAARLKSRVSNYETNFMLSLHGFTWIAFLTSTPWLAQMPKRNFKYITVAGMCISTGVCFVLAGVSNYDKFSVGCVVGGIGYGAITSCWEPTVQEFIGVYMWPKLQGTLETISGILLTLFVIGLTFIIEEEEGLRYCMLALGCVLAVTTLTWTILCIVSFYLYKIKTFK